MASSARIPPEAPPEIDVIAPYGNPPCRARSMELQCVGSIFADGGEVWRRVDASVGFGGDGGVDIVVDVSGGGMMWWWRRWYLMWWLSM
jgi:hypothetical protein